MPVADIFLVILPVFLTIGAGVLLTRIGVVRGEHVDGLMIFAQNIAIPCLLFRAMARMDLAASFDPALIAAFYLAAVACFFVGLVAARVLLDHKAQGAVTLGFSAMYTNALLLGVPVTEVAFGSGAIAGNFTLVAFQAPVCYAVGVTAMELARAEGGHPLATLGRTLAGIARQPHLLALAAGLAVNLIGLPLPAFVMQPADMIGNAALPVALFALGGVLTRYDIRGSLPATATVLAISLVLNPALTWLLSAAWLHLPPTALRSAVVTAAMAPGVNSFMFANTYGVSKDIAASALILGTALSIVTVSVWISLLT